MTSDEILAVGEREGDSVYIPNNLYHKLMTRPYAGEHLTILVAGRRAGKSHWLYGDIPDFPDYYIESLTVEPMWRKPVPAWLRLQEGL